MHQLSFRAVQEFAIERRLLVAEHTCSVDGDPNMSRKGALTFALTKSNAIVEPCINTAAARHALVGKTLLKANSSKWRKAGCAFHNAGEFLWGQGAARAKPRSTKCERPLKWLKPNYGCGKHELSRGFDQ
jgi:hypothetical protein